jgi:hypothetical protein
MIVFGRRPLIGLDLKPPSRRTGSEPPPRRRLAAGLETLSRRQVSPGVLLASVILHAAVIVFWLLPTRVLHRESPELEQNRGPEPRTVTMLYIGKKEVPARPKPKQQEPSPAAAEAAPPPSPALPPTPSAVAAEVPDHDAPAATSPEPRNAALHSAGSQAVAAREAEMVSEARRLFGPRGNPGAGSLAGPVQAGLPVRMVRGGQRCAWDGAAETSTADSTANGVVEGIIRSEETGRPLPGAFLQILGTGFAAFANDAGHYRLAFDPGLVDHCRSQLVRVMAAGYRARTLILALGNWSDNNIEMSIKRGVFSNGF